MKRTILFLTIALFAIGCYAQKEFYKIPVKDMYGKTTNLADYKGKVLLIVNTATRCGFTPQYKELEELYAKYRAQGFEVLDFPCNQFGAQAPEDILKIREFCTENYETTFPLYDKIDVNGAEAAPLFTYLKEKQGFKGFDLSDPRGQRMDNMLRKRDADYDKKSDIKWNFTKFLVDGNGRVVRRFEPTESMNSVDQAVSELLKKNFGKKMKKKTCKKAKKNAACCEKKK
ncbi:MAG: glutathione peroxidase [Prevotella sp.]|nr:glutathione peroxidase [Prevotella sp.]